MDRAHPLEQRVIGGRACRRRTRTPRTVTGGRHAEHACHGSDGKEGLVRALPQARATDSMVAGSRIGLHHVVAQDRRRDPLPIAEHHAVDVVERIILPRMLAPRIIDPSTDGSAPSGASKSHWMVTRNGTPATPFCAGPLRRPGIACQPPFAAFPVGDLRWVLAEDHPVEPLLTNLLTHVPPFISIRRILR